MATKLEPTTDVGRLSDYQRGYIDGFDAPVNVSAREAEARASQPLTLDVERLAKALWKTRPQMYPDAWPNDDPSDIGPHPEENAAVIAAEYERLSR